MTVDQDDGPAGPGGRVDGSDIVPEVPTLQLDDSGSDNGCKNDSGETNEGMLDGSDSDEFESDDDSSRCEMGEGQGLLEFELQAAKAGKSILKMRF